MNNQKIGRKYMEQLMDWCEQHPLSEFGVIYDNERHFAEHLNVETFKFVNSGTSALYLIMNTVAVLKPTPLVFGPSFCHVSWMNVCEWCGYDYEFVDVREETLSLDPQKLLQKIENGRVPDVVVMIDMGGYVGEDTLLVRDICNRFDILMIEDAANAFGQQWNGHKAGTIGDFAFYSFSNPKLLTAGEGGAIVCRASDVRDDFEEFIYQGGWYKYDKTMKASGLNFIMSNWMTQLLRFQLDDINDIQKDRHNQYLEHSEKYDLFGYESDNKYYSPSFYCYRQVGISKKILSRLSDREMYRYKNHDEDCLVGRKLQEELVYLPIR